MDIHRFCVLVFGSLLLAAAPQAVALQGYDPAGNTDVTPPTLSINSVQDGTVYLLPQTVTLLAEASDNVGVTKVEFYDNGALRATVGAVPYGYPWTFGKADNGTNTWTIRAYDGAGNQTSATVNLVVNIETNGPAVALTAPLNGSSYTNAQLIIIQADATSTAGITKVEFYDNGTLLNTTYGAPYVFPWDVAANDNGAHQLSARAYNAVGDSRNSAVVLISVNIPFVDSFPPSITLSAPADGASFSSAQTVEIQANAADNVGVFKVEFYEDGELRGVARVSPFIFAWSITSADNGVHEWTARAFDAGGNTTFSLPLALHVNVPASPQLSLEQSGNHYTLSWFASDPSYILQQSAGLAFPYTWTNVAMGPVVADAINRLTLAPLVASLRARNVGGELDLDWAGNATLQYAAVLAGPWQDIEGASSPYRAGSTERAGFYRLKPVGQVFYRLHRP